MRRSHGDTAPLDRAELAELREAAASPRLQSDMRRLRGERAGARDAGFDEYMRFATAVAGLCNHRRRPFRPITGGLFRL